MPVLRISDFVRDEAPKVTIHREGRWDGLALMRLEATRGLHEVAASDAHRVLMFTSGQVRVECASEDVRSERLLAPGEVDIVPSGATGSWFDHGATNMALLQLAPEAIVRLVEETGGRADGDLDPRLGWRDPHVEHLIRALLAELDSLAPVGRTYVDALSTALALRLVQTSGGRVPHVRGQTLTARQLRRIDEFIASHLDEDLSLASVAAAAGISVSHLTPMFRRTTGVSVHRYVLERRVRAARLLLSTTGDSIAEIALVTGFAHQSHLARWMRRIAGATPGQIRRSRTGRW